MRNSRLLIIGTLPETSGIGGVTIHVQRLLKCLMKEDIPGVKLCDYKKVNILTQVREIISAGVVHIHVSNPYLKLFYVIIGKLFNTRTIITVHGRYGIYGNIRNYVHKLSLKYCDVPVLINKESYDAVKVINPKSVLMSAFIRPFEEDENLPIEIVEIIGRLKETGKPIFLTNASNRGFLQDGREIYGFDFLVSYFSKHKDYILIVLDPSKQYRDCYTNLIPDNIVVYSATVSFSALLQLADVVVRNTATDGDSFSVKEALYYHSPVLASDVVSRPDGVFLFKYNDEISFDQTIKTLMSSEWNVSLKEPDAIECYMKLYEDLGVIVCK